MNQRVNSHGQPIGFTLNDWQGAKPVSPLSQAGSLCRIEPINLEKHAVDLFETCVSDESEQLWTYMASHSFTTLAEFQDWMQKKCLSDDPLFHALIDRRSGKAVGMAALMRIDQEHGVVEIGNILYSTLVQKTTLVTEAMYLFMRHVFELGYRRYEWKCDALNEPSVRAAKRLGFKYEGIFRQALVYKNRNRDTAWFSILDHEWPRVKHGYEQWLQPKNFDESGAQKKRLQDFINVDQGASVR